MKWIRRLFSAKNKQLYASTINLIEKNNITSLRKRIKILLVDDESDDIYHVLKERQYEVYYKSDMTYSIEAEPFEIIIMDIKGVAKRLKSNMEGFALACEVKARYPLKRVCCYSGSVHSEISEHLTENKIDSFWVKDIEIDKLCQKIDQLILDYVDYHKQWEVLRNEMIKNGIGESDIQKIKSAYLAGFENGNFRELNTAVLEILKDGAVILEITDSILSLMKALAA